MYTIAICVPTYKRPVLLKKLLSSILSCNIEKSLIKKINIIVVDNDIQRTAEKSVFEMQEKLCEGFNLNYFNFPVKGLSNVRNELLKQAFLLTPDFISFIDDDEFVTSEWLNELTRTIIKCNADAVRGPVKAVSELTVPGYIWCWFEREMYPDGSRIYSFKTGNLFLKRSSLQNYDIWFDNRFNISGAEDYYFGVDMIKKGATIYWSDKAITYETIQKERTSIYWLMKRWFRGANNFVYVLKLEKKYFKLITKLNISIIYIVFGLLTLPGIILPIKRRLWGILKISEGIGGIAGIINVRSIGY